jgi:hypothetical protein
MKRLVKSESLARFAEGKIAAGSTISSDAYRSYAKAFSAVDYQHKPEKYEIKEGRNIYVMRNFGVNVSVKNPGKTLINQKEIYKINWFC